MERLDAVYQQLAFPLANAGQLLGGQLRHFDASRANDIQQQLDHPLVNPATREAEALRSLHPPLRGAITTIVAYTFGVTHISSVSTSATTQQTGQQAYPFAERTFCRRSSCVVVSFNLFHVVRPACFGNVFCVVIFDKDFPLVTQHLSFAVGCGSAPCGGIADKMPGVASRSDQEVLYRL